MLPAGGTAPAARLRLTVRSAGGRAATGSLGPGSRRALTSSAAAGAVLFIAVVLAVGWIALWLDGFALWIVAPLGAAVLARALARDGADDAGLRLRLRGNLPWYGLSVLVPAACVLAVLGLGAAAGEISFAGLTREGRARSSLRCCPRPPGSSSRTSSRRSAGAAISRRSCAPSGSTISSTTRPSASSGRSGTSLYYVGILAAGSYDDYTSVELAWFLAILFPGLVAGSIVLGELRLATDSVWPPIIAHTASNALVFTLLFDDYVDVSSAALFTPGQEGVLIAALFAAAGVVMYVARVRHARGAG